MSLDSKSTNQEKFVSEFVKAHRQGYGFVPFFGAGLSVSAGVPIVKEITPYLKNCLARATGLADIDWSKWQKKFDGDKIDIKDALEFLNTHKSLGQQVWNPRRDNWPPFSDRILTPSTTGSGARPIPKTPIEFDLIKRWLRKLMNVVGQHYRDQFSPQKRQGQPNQRGKQDKPKEIEPFQLFGNYESFWDEVLGASSEWRTALLFLSRLVLVNSYTNKASLGLSDGDNASFAFTAPKKDVIDGFSSHLVAGRTPAREHRLFAYMSDILRIRVSLTTNFDDLYERAFYDTGKPITVFDVHQDAGMPPASIACLDPRTLIKMHGGKYGFRADYSLEASPSLDDQRHFVSYLLGSPLTDNQWHEKVEITGSTRHLFVVGLGGKDTRTQQLILTALRRLPALQVFWVCYNNSDEKFVKNLFQSDRDKSLGTRVHIAQYFDIGLLLLEIYQSITESIPRGGVEFPAVWRMPLPPEPFYPTGKCQLKKFNTCVDDVVKLVLGKQPPRPQRTSKLVVLSASSQSENDVVSVGAECFNQMVDDGKRCVWLDLDEVDKSDELRERLLKTLALRSGVDYWLPIQASKAARTELTFAKELKYAISGNGNDYVVFLNACEILTTDENGDFELNVDEEYRRDLYTAIAILAGPESPKINVVLLTYNEFSEIDTADIAKAWNAHLNNVRRTGTADKSLGNPTMVTVAYSDEAETKEGEPAKANIIHAPNSHHIETFKKIILSHHHPAVSSLGLTQQGILRFLITLTAFGRPRYPVSLCIWSALGGLDDFTTPIGEGNLDGNRDRWDVVGELLQFLRDKKIIRRKTGGLVWMHQSIRKHLFEWAVEMYEKHCPESPPPVIDAHQSIGDWYTKLFFASQDPVALFEALSHRIEAMEEYFNQFEKPTRPNRSAGKAVRNLEPIPEPRCRYLSGLLEAISLLKQARNLIRARGHTAGSSIWLQKFVKRLEESQKSLKKIEKKRHIPQSVKNQVQSATEALEQLKHECQQSQFRIAIDVGDAVSAEQNASSVYHSQRPNDSKRTSQSASPAPKLAEEVNKFVTEAKEILRRSYRTTGSRKIADCYQQFDKLIQRLDHFLSEKSDPDSNSDKAQTNSFYNCWCSIRENPLDHSILDARNFGGKLANAIVGNGLPIAEPTAKVLDEIIRGCRHAIYVDLIRAEAIRACDRVGIHRQRFPETEKPQSTWQACLKRAILTYHIGSELTRWQASRRERFVNIERARLKSFLALALTESRQYSESRRRLTEAFGLIDDHVGFQDLFWKAVLNIIQAETHLTRCRDSVAGLGKLRNLLCKYFYDHADLLNESLQKKLKQQEQEQKAKCGLNQKPDQNCEQIEKAQPEDLRNLSYEPTPTLRDIQAYCFTPENKRISLALIEDADSVLSQNVSSPVGGRQNVWWLGRYWLIKLKSIEYRIYASLEKEDSPLRIFGSKEAPTSSQTEADVILRDLIRVNRGDVFLLARAVHSYSASLAAVFFVWKTTTKQPERKQALFARLRRCGRQLQKAWEFLDEVFQDRLKKEKGNKKEEENDETKEKASLDPWCFAYVDRVHEHTREILERMGFACDPKRYESYQKQVDLAKARYHREAAMAPSFSIEFGHAGTASIAEGFRYRTFPSAAAIPPTRMPTNRKKAKGIKNK